MNSLVLNSLYECVKLEKIVEDNNKIVEDNNKVEDNNIVNKLNRAKGVEKDLKNKIYECLREKLEPHKIRVSDKGLRELGEYKPDISIVVENEIYICEIKSTKGLDSLIAFTQSYGCPDEAEKGFHYHLCRYISTLRKHILNGQRDKGCEKVYKVHAATYDILKYAICNSEKAKKVKILYINIIGLFIKNKNDPSCSKVKEFFEKFIDYLKKDNIPDKLKSEISESYEYVSSKLKREIIHEVIFCDCKKEKVKVENKKGKEKEKEVCLVYITIKLGSRNEQEKQEASHA